eukprot:TRINITY_DN30665_c0_g2_i1.p1 TRINITY_DN30665_c0_g2~~TRINITY_DN30665_c0_g2_i1.p1  ORF type:complete len:135 (+),score=12.56 TRINITY_DN30665_c0_g2_i1:67-471(+)
MPRTETFYQLGVIVSSLERAMSRNLTDTELVEWIKVVSSFEYPPEWTDDLCVKALAWALRASLTTNFANLKERVDNYAPKTVKPRGLYIARIPPREEITEDFCEHEMSQSEGKSVSTHTETISSIIHAKNFSAN